MNDKASSDINQEIESLVDDYLDKAARRGRLAEKEDRDGFKVRDMGLKANLIQWQKALVQDVNRLVVKAKIEELSKVQLEHGHYLTQTWVDSKAVTIEDRIKELEELAGGSGDE